MAAPAPTATSVSTSQASVTYGTPVTFTATVSAQSGSSAPSGSVEFYDTTTATELGVVSTNTTSNLNSYWTFKTTAKQLNATAGDTITAMYPPGSGFNASSGAVTQTVSALALTPTVTVANKTYNASTTGAISGGSVSGALSGDTVTLNTSSATATFASKNASSNVTVTVTGLTLSGARAADYTISSTVTTTANITAATLTVTGITAADKVYDGTTAATLNTSGAALVGVFSGDTVTLSTSGATGTFASRNVGAGITVSVAGLTVSGTAVTAGDYLLTQPTAPANITPLPITVTAASATKVYDGTDSSMATPTITSGGVVSDSAVVTTLAGSAGQAASNNGTGNAARLDGPQGVAVDSAGNVYVGDSYNAEIRKITPSGVVSTLAGAAGQQGSSDGTGSAASFNFPDGVAVDSEGNVYVAEVDVHEIRKITPSGVVTTLAGSAGQVGSSDGTGSAARFDCPEGVAVDSEGNVYVADVWNQEIRKISPFGVVTTLAGSAGQQGSTDGTGSAARFYLPQGVAVDSAGNVYVAEYGNDDIREITPSGAVSTLAGFAGEAGSSDGTGSDARFDGPQKVALDGAGNVYVADYDNDEIREISPSGVVTTLAGSAGQAGSSDGTGSAARFSGPCGVALDSDGNLYVADTWNDEIRKIGSTGLVSGDTAAFAESYASKNVGTGLMLTVSGSVNDGNGGNNYAVTLVSNTTGVITAATLTVSGITAANKTYDGNTTATLQGLATASLVGVLSGDTVTLGTSGAAGTFASKNVAQNLTVPVTGLTLGGAQAEDYTLTQPSTTANITARAIAVTATAYNKVYDGATSAEAAVPTITGGSLAAGDAAAFAETFDTRNAGVSKTLTPAGSVNDGNGGNNYAVTFVTGTLGAIAPCPITVTAAANTKPYDGSTTTAAIPTINAGSLASGDTLAFIETYDTPAVGTGKTLTPSGSVSDGNGGANYSVTFISNTAGAITQTADHFLVTASPASITAGNNFILVVTAEDVNDTAVANYAGAVQFSSFDGESVAQSVTCTGGVGYTVGTLKKAGTWTVTATDENNSSLSGGCTVTVSPAPASQVAFSAQVIVKRLGAIHDLGSMDVLCTDKTGTLTEAKIELTQQVALSGADSPHALDLAWLNSHFQAGLRNPLDAAIIESGPPRDTGWAKIDEVPFDFQRRRVSVLVEHAGQRLLITKGAPEDVIKLASRYEEPGKPEPLLLDNAARARAAKIFEQLSVDGFRVLGVAWRELEPARARAAVADEMELVFAGFVVFSDPPKASAGAAIAALGAKGVAVKILSGDNERVTQHVCTELGIPITGLLTGTELEALSDEALAVRLEETNLILPGRASSKKPHHSWVEAPRSRRGLSRRWD